jgi:flagellum-specific peptidoglycan hydrolase FlgJ
MLAVNANNHFGIKCHKDWTGETYVMDDDAKNECFRKYPGAYESFLDHATFLKGRPRYAPLFQLSPTDYKGWARGLKEAGYATNPKYAELLINTIDELKLHQYDLVTKAEFEALNGKPKVSPSTQDQISVKRPPLIEEINGLKATYVQPGESIFQLAERVNIEAWRLVEFNELSKDYHYKPGDRMFLERKNKKAATDVYEVKAEDNLHDIAQQFGVRLESLRYRNRLEAGEEPAEGEVLLLIKKREIKPKTRPLSDIENRYRLKEEAGKVADSKAFDDSIRILIDSRAEKVSQESIARIKEKDEQIESLTLARDNMLKEIDQLRKAVKSGTKPKTAKRSTRTEPEEEDVPDAIEDSSAVSGSTTINPEPVRPAPKDTARAAVPPVQELKSPDNDIPAGNTKKYKVEKGDTLFKVARKFGVKVDQIRKWNQMTNDNLKAGEEIKVGE